MKTILFPGSFDPFTIGHADIVERALKIFDNIVIAIGINEGKTPFMPLDQRVETIKQLYKDTPRVEVDTYKGLTTDYARQRGISTLLRGVRNITDFEYERNLADINRQICQIETIILFCKPELAAISSSTVRELHHFGKDITNLLP